MTGVKLTHSQEVICPANDEPRMSIALVTRHRAESLERALRSLREQSVQPWEVVVSDDSAPERAPETAAVVERYGGRYIRGPQRGLYANRNHVAHACQGTHVRTMDDDHELPPDHIARCLKALQEDPEAVWAIGEYMSHKYDPILAETVTPPPPGQFQPRGYGLPPPDAEHCWAIADGSTIFPKAIFDRGCEYIEDFPFGNAYYEFGSRLHWLGYRTRVLDTTYIIHNSREFELIGGTVWSGGAGIALASRFFAMLCHSLVYQPTPTNRLMMSLQIAKDVCWGRGQALQALRQGIRAYRNLRGKLDSEARASVSLRGGQAT